jgi:hypothetical protein
MPDESSSRSPSLSKPIGAWIAEIHNANSRGELLQAFDLAERALEEFPDDSVLRYNAVLALPEFTTCLQSTHLLDAPSDL